MLLPFRVVVNIFKMMTSSIFHIIGAHQMLGIIVEVFRPSAEMRLLLGKGKHQQCTAREEHLCICFSAAPPRGWA